MKWDNKRKVCTYLLAMCFVTCLTFVFLCIYRGANFHQIIFVDVNDIFMDYFNCVKSFTVGDPYKEYFNAYPAFTNIIWEILALFIPNDYRFSLESYALRENQYAMLIYILFIIGCLWAISVCLKIKMGLDKITESILIFALLFSYPMIFTIERGNLIILALIFTMFFVFFRNSDNKFIRELSYISLAFAAGIKIYPALLGVFLIKEKKLKEAIRLVIYGVVIFFVPFFAFYDGIASIKYMIKGLTVIVSKDIGCGYQYSLSNLFDIISRIMGLEMPNSIVSIVSVLVILLMLISFFVIKDEWKQVLALSLPMIFVPGFSATYSLIFLFIPFALFISKIYGQENISIDDKIYLALFFVILVPFVSSVVPGFLNDIYALSYSMLIDNLVLVVMVCLLVKDAIIGWLVLARGGLSEG